MVVKSRTSEVEAENDGVEPRSGRWLEMNKSINEIMRSGNCLCELVVRGALNQLEFVGVLTENIGPSKCSDEGIGRPMTPKVFLVDHSPNFFENLRTPNAIDTMDGAV
jgi:hypothetical protein